MFVIEIIAQINNTIEKMEANLSLIVTSLIWTQLLHIKDNKRHKTPYFLSKSNESKVMCSELETNFSTYHVGANIQRQELKKNKQVCMFRIKSNFINVVRIQLGENYDTWKNPKMEIVKNFGQI